MEATQFQHQQLHDPNLFQSTQHHHTLVSQLDLDPSDPFQFNAQFDAPSPLSQLQARNVLDPQLQHEPRYPDIQPHVSRSQDIPSRQRAKNPTPARGGQFGILTPHIQVPPQPQAHPEAFGRLHNEFDTRPAAEASEETPGGHFSNLKMIPEPPKLDAWRERLFNVEDVMELTEDEFLTYFPHVDNIYSHRSTQKYKRKPFISHYWDCRLKGRPPGTPKSDDPNKKKRKRQARERDLCDVKIKITEYFPGARAQLGSDFVGRSTETAGNENNYFAPGQPGAIMNNTQQTQSFSAIGNNGTYRPDPPGSDGSRFYTIQRVNGNGANGKSDAISGTHKHSLDDSDRVKKNSIQRHFLKEEKLKRRSQKTYHKKATGSALSTVKKHAKEHALKLIGSCFCPFVQRVWISLELKDLSYQYIEVDPYKKPDWLLEINPRGLVPALRHEDWTCYESTVLMEYLEDLGEGIRLLPRDAKGRAHSRLWTDHINRHIVPAFYHYLQAQEPQKQSDGATELRNELAKLLAVAHPSGPFFLGSKMSFVDVQMAPWVVRMRKVLKPYRGWPDPEPGSRWASWVEAIEKDPGVKATTSTDDLYLDSYERYAEDRPDTSQLANAVNSGRGLPHKTLPMRAPAPRPDCPFCAIAAAYPPAAPAALFPSSATARTSSASHAASTTSTSSTRQLAHILLSTPHLIAFLDHAPISRGHVLVATRGHREKLSDISVQEGSAVGKWLGVVSRAVMAGATEEKSRGLEGVDSKIDSRKGREREVGDWNVVQNNGARAAQVVPHVHFHIIPRVGDVPEVKARSWTVFGKGQREDLDEEDAEILLGRMKKALEGGVERVRQEEGEGAVQELIGDEAGKRTKL